MPNKITDKIIASGDSKGLTAAEPASVAKLPAKPPITIFQILFLFSHIGCYNIWK